MNVQMQTVELNLPMQGGWMNVCGEKEDKAPMCDGTWNLIVPLAQLSK